jgi:hypothetical protein
MTRPIRCSSVFWVTGKDCRVTSDSVKHAHFSLLAVLVCRQEQYPESLVLHRHYAGSQLKEYRLTKHNWTEQQYARMDWAAHEIAMKRADPRQHAFIVKLTYKWIPVHRKLYRQGNTTTKQCMLCGAEEEDYVHLFNCEKQRQWRANFEIALEAHLSKRGTAADLRTANDPSTVKNSGQ